MLLDFHLGNAVGQQPADAVCAFIYRDAVSVLIEYACTCQSRRPGADYGYLLAGATGRGIWLHPTFLEGTIDDRPFDVLDCHRRFMQSGYTASFTRSGTSASGKLREGIGQCQAFISFLPSSPIDQVIPFRNEIVDRAACRHAGECASVLAERHGAVHAAGSLLAKHVLLRKTGHL